MPQMDTQLPRLLSKVVPRIIKDVGPRSILISPPPGITGLADHLTLIILLPDDHDQQPPLDGLQAFCQETLPQSSVTIKAMSRAQFACSLERLAGSSELYCAPGSPPMIPDMPLDLPPIAPLDDRGLSPWGEVNPNKRTAQLQLQSASTYVALARQYRSVSSESLATLKRAAWYSFEAIFTLHAQLLPHDTFLNSQELRQKCLEIEPSAEPFLDEVGWVYEAHDEPEQVLPLAELRIDRLLQFVAALIEKA